MQHEQLKGHDVAGFITQVVKSILNTIHFKMATKLRRFYVNSPNINQASFYVP